MLDLTSANNGNHNICPVKGFRFRGTCKVWICFLSVKYLREVTPYFRKASIISEVGWELQKGFLSGAPPVVRFPQRADTRYLPLQLCHLARNFRYPDPGKFLLFMRFSLFRRCSSGFSQFLKQFKNCKSEDYHFSLLRVLMCRL